MIVKATREGLLGKATASGYVVDTFVPFVALPAVAALRRAVRVTNPKTGISHVALVLDVGPWNEHDEAYVFGGKRPQAETGTDMMGRKTNKAGIDLGEWMWRTLRMVDNGLVEWHWVDAPPLPPQT